MNLSLWLIYLFRHAIESGLQSVEGALPPRAEGLLVEVFRKELVDELKNFHL